MSDLLQDFPIYHGGIKPFQHPTLKTEVNGQTAVRYFRFAQLVQIDRLELAPAVYGRWVPAVPLHPAHIIVSVLDPHSHQWKIVKEANLPRDPRISGEGLSQRMTAEQMQERLALVLKSKPHIIRLRGLKTDHLRVECDREHPMWPNHGETNGGEFNVPFGALNTLKAFGRPSPTTAPALKYLPPLKQGSIRPVAPRGMTVKREPTMLRFTGPKFAVGFSLHRPMLLHLGWDAFGRGRSEQNRLVSTRGNWRSASLSGPMLRTLNEDCLSHHWTGRVSVEGNRVTYQDLRCAVDGLLIDAVFTVEAERLTLQLVQKCTRAIVILEAFSWLLAWDLQKRMTGAMAMPTLRPGRNGEVHLPMLWAGDGAGCLACQVFDKKNLSMQVESYRSQWSVEGGFFLTSPPSSETCAVIPVGSRESTIEWSVTSIEPQHAKKRQASFGVKSNWSASYACFRPEWGGFSNHAASCNCHASQGCPAELIAFTRRPQHGPDPLDLYRFTIERALLDGGGYGYWRSLYLDADPVLLSGAGRIFQSDPDPKWLLRVKPGLLGAVKRVFGTLGKEGLAISGSLSGNSGSHRWSSNACDVVGFGYMDAYVNAWTYRALRNATAMLDRLEMAPLARQCRERAEILKAAFPKYLLNPDSGWVAGWRSRDGKLHDAAFTWINGPACAFGLLDRAAARKALLGLENLRDRVGAGSGIFSLPINLLPIDPADHMLPKILGRISPTFETYTDGSKSAFAASYYLRALSIAGLKERAGKLARELDEGYAADLWCGGAGSGVEFRCWDGVPSGYEGTFVANFGTLYGIAIEQKLFAPPTPEWWPAGG